MPTTNDSTAVKKLKTKVDEQNKQISSLRGRIGELVDTITMLEREVQTFKKEVAVDMESLNDRIR